MGHRLEGVPPLETYDLKTGPSLGIVGFPEFDEFCADLRENGNNTTSGNTIWTRLTSLNAYAAGKPVARIGKITPVLEPFMSLGSGEVVDPYIDNLLEANLAVDGLYRYMSHPTPPVIYSFGSKSVTTVHLFLNHRIGEARA